MAYEETTDTPQTPLSYRGLSNREKLLKAVSEGNHLSRQICAASGLSIGEITYEIERLETAQNEKEIDGDLLVIRIEPTFRAYFTPETAPNRRDKLVLESDGVRIIKFKKAEIPSEIWEQKRREIAGRNKNPKPYIPPKIIKTEEETSGFQFGIGSPFKKEKTMDKKITNKDKMKPEILKELAAQGLSQRKAAEKLGIPYGSFVAILKNFPDLKAAWTDGTGGQNHKGAAPKYNDEMFEDWGRKGFSQQRIAELNGISVSAVYHQFRNNPSRKSAYDRGIEQRKDLVEQNAHSPKTDYSQIPVTTEEDEAFSNYQALKEFAKTHIFEVESDTAEGFHNQIDERFDEIIIEPRFKHQLEYISQNGHNKESIEKKKQEFIDGLPSIETPISEGFPREFYMDEQESAEMVHCKSTKLGNGKTLTIGTNANIFETSEKEFELISKMRALVNEYERENYV